MNISLKWLRDYVDVPISVEELAERLTMAGLEVEGITQSAASLMQVITARIEGIRPHPNADRLSLCEVTAGSKTYQVVCGAPNLVQGSIVPLALPGAVLSSGMAIEEATVRGEQSHGMLCSQKELGLGFDESGIWMLPAYMEPGLPLAGALGLDDVIFEIGVTPNRGDCLCVIGIAREVAALCKTRLRYPETPLQESGAPIETLTSITVDDLVGCPRYAARIVEGIRVGPSPDWLRGRLQAVGLRSINNIVDVTNYVMMEMGQPLHAFDFDRLRERRIVVRRALEGERFRTLDGLERELHDDTLLICDGVGPVAIAGIMGGLDSEIVPETKRVLIESAYFDPLCIRRSSKRLGLRSESSYRFERGVDPEGVIRALDRAALLMHEIGGGEIANGRIDVYPAPLAPPPLMLRVDRTNQFLGTDLDASEMADALKSIEMDVECLSDNMLRVRPPSFRGDISREVDLAEEVARIVGYEHIPVTRPKGHVDSSDLDPHLASRLDVKEILTGAGFFEVITYSFISHESLLKLQYPENHPRLDPVRIKNPLSEELTVMRTSLLPGLIQAARHNIDRGNEDLRLFELSKIFLPREGQALPDEPHQLVGVMAGRRVPYSLYGSDEEVDYADLKGAVEEVMEVLQLHDLQYRSEGLPPYLDFQRSACIYYAGECIGYLGQLAAEVEKAFDLKKPVHVFELDFDRMYAKRCPRPLFQALPKFPSVVRDIALVVDEGVPAKEPLDYIQSQQLGLLEQIEIFDIYRNPQLGDGKKSLGYRLLYRAVDRSLTDEEVNTLHGQLVDNLMKAFDATLR